MDLLGDALGVNRGSKIDVDVPEQDQILKDARQTQYDQAMKPANDYAQKYESAIQHGRGLMGQDQSNSLWSEAINAKANQRFNSMADQLRRRAQYDQTIDQNKILGAALKSSNAQRELDRHIQMRKAEAEANYQAERARAISSILSTTGTVIGAAVGGPMGAAAGNKAGGSIYQGGESKPMGRGVEQGDDSYGDYSDKYGKGMV